MVRGFVPLCTGNVVISVMFQFLITHEENVPDVQQWNYKWLTFWILELSSQGHRLCPELLGGGSGVYHHSRVTILSNKKFLGWETVTEVQLLGPTHVLHMDLLWLSFYSLQIHCSNLTAWCSSGCPYHEWRDLWAHTSHHHSRFSCPTDCFHLYANKMEEVAELPAGHFGIHKHHLSSVD